MSTTLFQDARNHVGVSIALATQWELVSIDSLKTLKAEMDAEAPESLLHSDYRYLVARIRKMQDLVRGELHAVSYSVLEPLKAAEDCLKREAVTRWSPRVDTTV